MSYLRITYGDGVPTYSGPLPTNSWVADEYGSVVMEDGSEVPMTYAEYIDFIQQNYPDAISEDDTDELVALGRVLKRLFFEEAAWVDLLDDTLTLDGSVLVTEEEAEVVRKAGGWV